MNSFFDRDHQESRGYTKLLSAIAKLSGLFSDSHIPYINYRVAENVFCRSFSATNLSRSDTAFDAQIEKLGIGLKTFTCTGENSVEKVAEFNALSSELSQLQGQELAIKLGEYRNERIGLARRLYGVEDGIYHIVARRPRQLIFFETDYSHIDIHNIQVCRTTRAGLQFTDGLNEYSFNRSKSTLFRRFSVPSSAQSIPVDILQDPYDLLLNLVEDQRTLTSITPPHNEYVILPLYGTKNGYKTVFPKSGLNQWNAGGRKRDLGEIYIPIPTEIHRRYPGFFPQRDTPFRLEIPTGEVFDAKVCQENSKALMTNPNKSMSDWLLRQVFLVQEGELLSYDRMRLLGFDCVIVYKDSDTHYRIDKASLNSYERFLVNGREMNLQDSTLLFEGI